MSRVPRNRNTASLFRYMTRLLLFRESSERSRLLLLSSPST